MTTTVPPLDDDVRQARFLTDCLVYALDARLVEGAELSRRHPGVTFDRLHAADAVSRVPHHALWSSVTARQYWLTASSAAPEQIEAAKRHVSFILDRALAHRLVSAREIVDRLSIAGIVAALPPTEIVRAFERALYDGEQGSVFTAAGLLGPSMHELLVAYFPVSELWSALIDPLVARRFAAPAAPAGFAAMPATAQSVVEPDMPRTVPGGVEAAPDLQRQSWSGSPEPATSEPPGSPPATPPHTPAARISQPAAPSAAMSSGNTSPWTPRIPPPEQPAPETIRGNPSAPPGGNVTQAIPTTTISPRPVLTAEIPARPAEPEVAAAEPEQSGTFQSSVSDIPREGLDAYLRTKTGSTMEIQLDDLMVDSEPGGSKRGGPEGSGEPSQG